MKPYLTLFIMAICGLTACEHKTPTIVFTANDGFNGLFMITADKQNGVEPKIIDDQYIFAIPLSGILAVKNTSVLTAWHKTEVHYNNGTIIFNDSINQSTGYSVWDLPSIPGKGYFWFIGTPLDFDFVSKKYDFDKLPLGVKIDLK